MKIRLCVEKNCKNQATTKDYCRLHYLKNWKNLKDKEQKKAAEKLNKYVEGIVKKFPDRYVDVIRRDIRNEKSDFHGLLDDPAESQEDSYDSSDFRDDEGVNQLLSRIKVDKEF